MIFCCYLYCKDIQKHFDKENYPEGYDIISVSTVFKYLVKMLRMVAFVFFLLNNTKFFMLMMLVCLCLLQDALSAMTGVAHHINEMKRQHEQAVHVQVKKLHFLMLNFSEVIK